MGTIDFERAVLRELDQIRGLIVDGLREAQRANGTLDEELSELRLKVALLEQAEPREPKTRRNWLRDGGLVLTPSLLIPLAQALIAALQAPAPPVTSKPAPAAIVQPMIPGP